MADPNPNANPKDPALEAAELQAALAKAQKEKAEAELATRKAEFSPLGDQAKITAPSGDLTATSDQAGFVETQMLAQEAARVIAKRLKDRLNKVEPEIKTLIIYSGTEIASLSALASVLEQFEQLAKEFDKQDSKTAQVLDKAQSIIDESETTTLHAEGVAELATALVVGPSIATGVVKSVVELVNLFRTTTEFKRQTVTVAEDMIVSYLVNQFGGKVTVYHPTLFSPNVIDGSGRPGFAAALNELNDKRLAAEDRIEELAVMETNLTTKNTTAPIANLQSAIKVINDTKSELELLITAVEQLTASLRTPDATSKDTLLSQLIRAARLASIMKESGAFTLRLSVTANGTTMIRKNAFTSARAEHSAGVSLVYQLFDLTGNIVNADALQFYFEFKTSQDVREITSP